MTSGKLSIVVAITVLLMSCMTPTPVKCSILSSEMSCIQALIPCASYVNSTTPPVECCGPLKKAFETQLKCLCDAFNNPTLTAPLGINVTQVAQTLPMYCNITADVSSCPNAPKPSKVIPMAVAPVTGSTPEATSSTGKPAPPPGTSGGRSLSQVSGMILAVASLMLY